MDYIRRPANHMLLASSDNGIMGCGGGTLCRRRSRERRRVTTVVRSGS